MAEVKLLNINPTIKMDITSRKYLETIKMSSNTRKLPAQEANMIPCDESRKSVKKIGKKLLPKTTKATPKLEPELNPKTNGPANGFLKNVCINKPLIESETPTNIAVMALGKR